MGLKAQPIQINSYRNYDTKKGLAGLNVRKVIQDRNGFIWCGTQDGISRFDGKSFVNFSQNTLDNRYLLKGTDVFDLLVDENGEDLWALTTYGGLNKISINQCRVIERYDLQREKNPAIDYWYKCMRLSKGNIYIGTDQGVLLKFNIEKKKVIASVSLPEDFKITGPIDELFMKKDQLWIFSSNAGVVITDTAFKQPTAIIGDKDLNTTSRPGFYFYDLVEMANKLFVATDIGLKIIDEHTHSVIPFNKKGVFPASFEHSIIRAITSQCGKLYASGDNGLFEINMQSGMARQILFSKNIENRNWFALSNVLMVSGNMLWVATQYGVLNTSLLPTAFTSFNNSLDKKDVKIQHSMTLLAINDSMLFTCADDGLYLTNQNNGIIQKVAGDRMYYTVFKKNNDEYIASGDKSLLLLDGTGKIKNIEARYPELKPLKTVAFITTASYKDSLYYLASLFGNGIYIWDPARGTVDQLNTVTNPAIESNTINRLYVDKQDHLWVICDNCFSIYNPADKTIKNFNIFYPGTNKPVGINMDICETRNNYWIAAYGTGILKLNKNNKLEKIIGVENDINNLGLYRIAAIGDTSLAVSSNNGLSIVSLDGKKTRNYFESDGLNTDNFEETSGDIYRNTLFFGGLNGFTKIEPAKLILNEKAPSVFFTKVLFEREDNFARDTAGLTLKRIIVDNYILQSTIFFSGINYSNPDLTTFAYKIDKLHTDWIQLSTQNFVTLIGLAPGTYHLQVKAANEDGVWSEPKELVLVFLPKWYQTLLFKILVVLVIASIIYALYRYRISQIKKQHAIRRNIATDLHDDLGSTLNSVKVFTNLAISGVNKDESLQQIKDNLKEATIGLRDMIWVLDDSLDTVDELVTRLKQFALPVAAASNIQVDIKTEPGINNKQLTKEEKRNLFLVCKEAINNSIKYAAASRIDIGITSVGKKIRISIADNGKGFDEATIKKGYGLKNMQYRSSQVKYKTSLQSAPGKGTVIDVFPI